MASEFCSAWVEGKKTELYYNQNSRKLENNLLGKDNLNKLTKW